MQNFEPSHFFDLSQFAHAAIFDGCQYVWQALGRIKEYLRVYPLGMIASQKQELAYFVNPSLISIGDGTIIEPSAYIQGPCIIGKNCHIRHGAYIRGEVIVGDNCVIGHTTEVKHSIILNHTNAAHFAYLGDSVIGSFVNLGAGVKCANLRLDGKEVVIHTNGQEIPTGLRKFGAIIGDYSEIGCNSVLNPGAVLAKHVQAYPCLSFGGVIEENACVMPAQKVQIKNKV